MWVGVTRRFSRFDSELALTQDQLDDGLTKQFGVRQSLERSYYGSSSESPPGFIVGSWAKGTQTRPPKDIDIFFVLPADDYHRFNNYVGNGQSALLQEVKGCLSETYPQTDMRGDGQVVQVKFNTLMVEVVPAFRTTDEFTYLIPDTHEGGRWKNSSPEFESAVIGHQDNETNGNVRSLCRMMKTWKRHFNVPLKSFQIELLVKEFLENYEYRLKDYFYFDWFVRDFFRYLIGRGGTYLWVPGIRDSIPLGNSWLGRAQTAFDIALTACKYEYDDLTVSAGLEWQKLFGTKIPAAL